MSLRKWLLTGIAWLGAGLLPGCVSSPVDPTLDPQKYVPDLPRMRAHGPESPYHQQPDPATLPPQAIRREEPAPQKVEAPAAPPTQADQSPPAKEAVESARVVPAASQQSDKKITPPDEPIVTAMRAFLHKRPDEALGALNRYDKPNQDMLLVVLPFAAQLTEGDASAMSPDEAARLADLLQGVEDRLRRRAALHIDKMLFARRIDDFGVYVPREPHNGDYSFEGGAGDQVGEEVLVYLELRNVSSRQRGDAYETRLAGTVELIDFQEHSAYRRDFSPPPHVGRSPRRDFFVKCSFSVPRKVPPGRYKMRVEIRDVTGLPPDPAALKGATPSHRVAEQTLDLRVTTPRSDRITAGR